MESDLERIIRSKQPLSDPHLKYFLYQILRGLKYVHSANVLHRDLKPSNLLVNSDCGLALCDFGLARGFDAGVNSLTEYVVTRWYRPPELLLECHSYGKPVDIWSVGCIFAELLVHDPFFKGENPQHQLEVIVSKIGLPPKEKLRFIDSKEGLLEISRIDIRSKMAPFESYFPADTNPVALDLLQKMLQFSPDDRISVQDALKHPYLEGFHGVIPEPDCERLFDFEFERRCRLDDGDMTEEEVRRLMFEEVCRYRPTRNPRRGKIPPSTNDNNNNNNSNNDNSNNDNNHNNHHNSGSGSSSSAPTSSKADVKEPEGEQQVDDMKQERRDSKHSYK